MNKQYEEIDIKRIADFHSTLSQCPIHLFGLKREDKGDYVFTHSSGTMYDALGVANKPAPGTKLNELHSKELVSNWTPQIEKAFSGETQTADIEVANQKIRTTLYPVTGENRVIGTSYMLPLHDQTESIRDNKFRQLFDHALEAIVLCRSNLEIAEVNERACELLELPRDELVGRNAGTFFMKNGKEIIKKKWKEVMYGNKISGEFRYRTPAGYLKEIEYTCEKDMVDHLHVTILKDVTDQKITEQKLLKAETLNVVGELAAGVAHEIRNPLTSLKGFVQLIQNQTDDFDQYLSIILSEVDRIEHIIKEFLVLSKSNSQNFKESCIDAIIKDTVDLLNTQAIMKNIEISTGFENEIPLIFCDPMQLKQVFINFIKNAIEASSDGNKVDVNIKWCPDTNYVQIQICDYGCGMEESVLKKIGKPFFTTKDEGTGLGLMVSNNIIKHHNGKLDVQSEKGIGTKFIISLPVNQQN
ncbi:ATP-binding protein [Fictibacillus phosphorivorans]|uniref:ATP-binding protein n=1 Tax=Fictibacillus phosphorivorans TaxID=1221500 RepID=UPI00203BC200|nr:ATP-binding protein [Fictibacillus phosphorivorans]MCM3717430.1 ATP-binding protein [Fictibacillus phosphorivorans]MCM3775125.1 ATP-binding protein [Fictibacillus phosphorivorans]